ncbi:hypothetical protein [Mesobacillus foraminis]|uniref:hypothetical protein n=1 Tax=Mesobacillus foraminis TaxID=279826 RepID=UPI0015E70F93|nr:hypothetical protein [Mesobacillus foraminis]
MVTKLGVISPHDLTPRIIPRGLFLFQVPENPSNRNAPFYSDGNSIGATTWFKANDNVSALWVDLDFYFKVLKKYGVELTITKSKNPGKIIYEDDFQVGVIKV